MTDNLCYTMDMKKIEIEKNLVVYQFEPTRDGNVGSNLYMLLNGAEALLIDAGYAHQMQEVLHDIDGKYTIAGVIPSHFHPDHIDGIRLLDTQAIYGNPYAVNTIRTYLPEDEALLSPTVIVDNETKLRFGDFNLQFEHAPGHSDCSMLIFINRTYVHVGDLYITMNDGTDVLPFVKWTNVPSHIESLKRIQTLSRTLLTGHGTVAIDETTAKPGIEDRLSYLQALLATSNTCTVQEALQNSRRPFAKHEWREFVK